MRAIAVASLVVALATLAIAAETQVPATKIPQFEFDATWPKQPFPHYEILGNVIGLAVDAKQHIWVLHRSQTLTEQEQGTAFDSPDAICCRPAKPVLEIDQAGNVVQSWGGPGPNYVWPVGAEHAIHVDRNDNVWIGSLSASHLLKFTRDGRYLMTVGEPGHKEPTSTNTMILGGPAPFVDAKTNELFVADGYRNRRVIVFDADTGVYKRHWGAYGKPPDDGLPWTFNPAGMDKVPSPQFQMVTHVTTSNDGLVYVADRANSRIQVFHKDGTFVKEGFIEPKTRRGSLQTLAFSADKEQQFLYAADSHNMRVWILRRSDLAVLGWFGHGGHQAGGFVSSAYVVTDAKGNLYVGEGQDGKRVQRFLYKGLGRTSGR